MRFMNEFMLKYVLMIREKQLYRSTDQKDTGILIFRTMDESGTCSILTERKLNTDVRKGNNSPGKYEFSTSSGSVGWYTTDGFV